MIKHMFSSGFCGSVVVFVVLCVFGVILGPFGVGKLVWGVSRILSSMSQYCRVLVICFFLCVL